MRVINSNSSFKALTKASLKALFGIVFVSYFALTTVPWVPNRFSYHLDESFRAILNVAFAQKLQFGTELVYTYGPYGFLHYPKYFPETYDALVAGRFFIGTAIGVGLLKIFDYCWQRHRKSVAFLAPLLFFSANVGMYPDSLFVFVIVLPLVVYFYVEGDRPSGSSASLFFLVAGAAFVSLIKHTFFILGVALLLLISIDQVFRRRRIPSLLLTYVICLAGFWLLAGQSLMGFPAYLINGSQIVKGFSATMGLALNPFYEVVFYPLSVAIFLGLVWQAARQQKSKV